ncbi:hypothetical protein CHS0354_033814, partial [Potamilus streckersoni]
AGSDGLGWVPSESFTCELAFRLIYLRFDTDYACNQNFWIGAKRGEPGTNEFYYVGGAFLNGSDTRYWNSSPQENVNCVAQTNSSAANKLDAKDCSLMGGYVCQIYLRNCEGNY